MAHETTSKPGDADRADALGRDDSRPSQSEASAKAALPPPPLPGGASKGASAVKTSTAAPILSSGAASRPGAASASAPRRALPQEPDEDAGRRTGETRRSARRKPAGPQASVAANDDVPSIGGLIFALQQKPSRRPLTIAAIASGAWVFVTLLLGAAMLVPEIQRAPTLMEMLSRPTAITLAATLILPIALFWFLAMLIRRAQELRDRKSVV